MRLTHRMGKVTERCVAIVMSAIVVAATGVVATVLAPGIAEATPSRGVSGRILAHETVNGRDFILREITIGPGGSTGWHYHLGEVYAWVQSGTLTHTAAVRCRTTVYRAGSRFDESIGRAHAHVGRNLGRAPVVLLVLYVNPAGSALSQD